MLKFGSPSAFYLLFALPLLILLVYWMQGKSRKVIERSFGEKLTPFLISSVSPMRRKIKFGFELLALAFFILALTRPQFGQETKEVKSTGVEMIIAVDVSESMLAEDVKPSRLEFAKNEVERFLQRSSGNKVGLVAFAGSAALVSPMTSDLSGLLMFIESLSPESVSSQGTNFKKALEQAAEAFKRGGTVEDETTKATQVILIASDGEDHEPGAIEVAQQLASEGYRIFTVAVGTEKGAPIPVRDTNNYLRGYKKDKDGKTILTATKGTILKALAEAGKGAFYYATLGGNYQNQLVEDIGKLEQAEFDSARVTDYEERYQPLLFVGLLLALLELLLRERRAPFRSWKGRYEVPPM